MSEMTVAAKMLRAATAMKNACMETIKNNCKGCPFEVNGRGCNLYEHPFEWDGKIERAKRMVNGNG